MVTCSRHDWKFVCAALKILGIQFFTTRDELMPALHKSGGLVAVPSGPGLALDLVQIPVYRRALLESDFVIPDSGYMVIIWNLIHVFQPKFWMKRYSGLGLIRDLLDQDDLRGEAATFWIMPSDTDTDINLRWLKENALPKVTRDDCYVAPYYRATLGPDGRVEDADLLKILQSRRPKYIFINIGSGVQEQLGLYLKENLDFKPAILCTGAAIAFLTGAQASIPPWADRYFMGWLLRIIQDPKRFGIRYWKALRLFQLMVRYGKTLPPPAWDKK